MPSVEVSPALKAPLVIKIGGSSFSDKNKQIDYSSQVFPLVAREIPKGTAVIIVVGGGYKAHEYAKQQGLNLRETQSDALKNKQAEWATISYIIDRQVNDLRDCMRAEPFRHPLMPLSTPAFFKRIGGALVLKNFGDVLEYLNGGFIPVFHGDGIPDSIHQYSILSGDNIVVEFLNALPIGTRAIFCTDVPGVLKPGVLKPGAMPNPKTDVLKHLRVEQLGGVKVKKTAPASAPSDVTGLMGGKLLALRDMRRGRTAQIIGIRDFNGNPVPGQLSAAIAGKNVGTLIE